MSNLCPHCLHIISLNSLRIRLRLIHYYLLSTFHIAWHTMVLKNVEWILTQPCKSHGQQEKWHSNLLKLFPPHQHIFNGQYCFVILKAMICWLAEKHYILDNTRKKLRYRLWYYSPAHHCGKQHNIVESILSVHINKNSSEIWHSTQALGVWGQRFMFDFCQLLASSLNPSFFICKTWQ